MVWWATGAVLLSFDLVPPWLEWANVVFLVASGLLAMLYFYRSADPIPGLLVIALCFILSMAAESMGVYAGLFFGDYTYMTDFGPKVAGVPIAIGFAWVMVMATSHALAAPITTIFSRFTWLAYAVYGALVATALDLIIDPVAAVVKQYWVWHQGGLYYGIPFTNFLGWFGLSFVLHLAIFGFYHRQSGWANVRSPLWNQRMVLLYGMIVLIFVVVALVNGLFLAVSLSVLSLLLFYGVYFALRRRVP